MIRVYLVWLKQSNIGMEVHPNIYQPVICVLDWFSIQYNFPALLFKILHEYWDIKSKLKREWALSRKTWRGQVTMNNSNSNSNASYTSTSTRTTTTTTKTIITTSTSASTTTTSVTTTTTTTTTTCMTRTSTTTIIIITTTTSTSTTSTTSTSTIAAATTTTTTLVPPSPFPKAHQTPTRFWCKTWEPHTQSTCTLFSSDLWSSISSTHV